MIRAAPFIWSGSLYSLRVGTDDVAPKIKSSSTSFEFPPDATLRPIATVFRGVRMLLQEMAPQVGLEPTTLRLTAGCSATFRKFTVVVSWIKPAKF